MLKIHSLETFGTHDGPGVRLVIFLQGCNFRCLYCHNPDTHDINGGSKISFKKVFELAKEQENYFGEKGGVTASGGEPLLQAEVLTKLFKALKKRGIHTVLDTNGGVFNPNVKELLKYTDLVLLDIKHIDSNQHQQLVGASNKQVLMFADYLRKINKPFWLRYVLVAGLTDQPKYIKELGERFKDFENIERVEILPYHSMGVYKYYELGKRYALGKHNQPDKEGISKVKRQFERYFKNVFSK